MTPLSKVTFLAAVVLLAACDSVVIDRPLGEAPGELDTAALDGAWYLEEEGAEPFYVHAASGGRVSVAAIEWQSGAIRVSELELHLMTIEDGLYLSGTAPEEPGDGYYFGRVAAMDETEWRLLPPDVEVFREAVESGRLTGSVSEGRFTTSVEVDAGELVEFIRGAPADALWNDGKAIIVRKFTSRGTGTNARAGPPPGLFVVHFETGPNWDEALAPAEQTGFRDHSANLRRLREQGAVAFGARYEEFGMILLRAETLEAATALMEADPGVQARIFTFRIAPLNVFYPWQR